MSSPFCIYRIISIKLIIIIEFIHFVFPTAVEDIRMAMPVFLSTQAILFSPSINKLGGVKRVFTSLCDVC